MRKRDLERRWFAFIMILLLCVESLCMGDGGFTTVFAKAKAKQLIVKVSKKTLYVGGSISKRSTKIKVKVKPNKTSKKVRYKSSNKKVIKVSKNGIVTAKKVGKATVTVQSKANKKLKKKIKFTVRKYKKGGTSNENFVTNTKTPSQLTYTVSFNSNGGSQVLPFKVKPGDTVSEPPMPTRTGYIFVGWYTSLSFNEMFLFDSDKINEDITLYADWIRDDKDSILVAYALSQISIGYQEGDNTNNVTRDLILPKTAEEVEGVTLSWESSLPNIVSSDGSVNRPDDYDSIVKLNVTANLGQASETKAFSVRVIHINKRDSSSISDNSIVDIQNMNKGNASITYNSDNTQVTSITGKYSDIVIKNSDDALDSIQSVHSILGVDDPYDELKINSITEDKYGASYSFCQIYDGYNVYGRNITVTASADGNTDSLNSGFCKTSQIEKTQMMIYVSEEEAESIVKEKYGEKYKAVAEQDKVIYSLLEYEKSPVLVYVIHVTGEDGFRTPVNEHVFVNAGTGDIIFSYSDIVDASSKIGSGHTEDGKKVSFPVALNWLILGPFNYAYYMYDINRNIQVYSGSGLIKHRIGSNNNHWTDKTAISAYTNMIKVYDWYKNTFGRNSVDGNGMKIKIIVHDYHNKDNAAWNGKSMIFYDNSSGFGNTTASGLDIAGHEYTHGVVQYVVPCDMSYAYNYLGSINEGYADIFGCLIEGKNWIIGEDWTTLRDAENPQKYECPSKLNGEYYLDPCDKKNNISIIAHRDSSLLYHAAYLMSKDGISDIDLANLWYLSLRMGYNATSDFYTVRDNVIKAGIKMNLSDRQMAIIRRAFDSEGIYDEKGNVKINFVDLEGNSVDLSKVGDVIVNLKPIRNDVPITEYEVMSKVNTELILGNQNTKENQSRLMDNYYNGKYELAVSVPGYVTATAMITINSGQITEIAIPLVEEGWGAAGGIITSATTGEPVAGVTFNVYSGWNQSEGETLYSGTTDYNGKYFIELSTGFYTVVMKKKDYTTGYLNIVVSSRSESMSQNGSISPIMKLGKDFRVVLTWGENPEDLDSHLFGSLPDGINYHIYYKDQYSYDSEGFLAANLDVDDTTSFGPETTTFTAFSGGDYEYYVDWYDGIGSWAKSGGKVEIYNGGELIYVLNVPHVDSQSGSWKVFSFKNGIFKVYNEIQKEDIYIDW